MTDPLPDDADIMARTICGEARGEGHTGMEDVSMVIMNRARIAKQFFTERHRKHLLYGDGSPASACLAPWQFSCWNKGDPNREIILALSDKHSIFRDAIAIARRAICGQLTDRTQGATHYFVRKLPKWPAWSQGKTPCYEHGSHVFFNDIE